MAFNPDQPRDELGRWASGGSGREMTQGERRALDEYSGIAYAETNAGLRQDKLSPEAAERVKQLDSAFESTVPLGEPATVYRGMNAKHVPEVGSVLTDKAFVSTSLEDEQAFIFAEKRMMPGGTWQPDRQSAVLVITVPKGARVISMNKRGLGVDREKEVLLPRGSRFRVTKRETQTRRGPRTKRRMTVNVVHVELVL